jgi:competence protein ComGC
MKGLIIVILILLVLGLYFVPAFTKSAIKTTGHATVTATKWGFNQIKDNKEYNDTKDNIINKTKEEINNLRNK